MQATLERPQSQTMTHPLVTLFMAVMGVASLIFAHQVVMGWVALGQRANISRANLNINEIFAAVFALLIGLGALRTAWGLATNEPVANKWAQWMAFIFIIAGLVVDNYAVLSATQYSEFLDNFSYLNFFVGLVILVPAVFIYMQVTRGHEHTPLRQISIQLAESPSAGAIIGFVVILMGFSMATHLFLEPTSIASVLSNNATKGIMAIGITILMISGEFDLSVGSVLGAASMVFMISMTEGTIFYEAQSVVVSAVIALAVASFLGFVNGMLLITTRIPSFIVTLGTLFAYRAVVLVTIAGGRILRYRDYYSEFPQLYINRVFIILPVLVAIVTVAYLIYYLTPQYLRHYRKMREEDAKGNKPFGTLMIVLSAARLVVTIALLVVVLVWLGLVVAYHAERLDNNLQVGFFDVANGRWAFTLEDVTEPIRPVLDEFTDLTGIATTVSIPRDANFRMAIVWWIVLVIIFQIILMNTRYGNSVFAVGGNIGAARAQGINANRVKVQNFVLTSFLTGVAAIFEVARNPGVDPLKGNTWELEVIAMTVIGGTLLTGGYGSIIGTMLGVLIFGMLQTGLVLVGMDSRMFQGVVGAIMIIAVILNNLSKRNR